MALCRCKEFHAWPTGRDGRVYVAGVEPIGYPNLAVICGVEDCDLPGMLWLNKEEEQDHRIRNQRIFRWERAYIKIKVGDNLTYKPGFSP